MFLLDHRFIKTNPSVMKSLQDMVYFKNTYSVLIHLGTIPLNFPDSLSTDLQSQPNFDYKFRLNCYHVLNYVRDLKEKKKNLWKKRLVLSSTKEK